MKKYTEMNHEELLALKKELDKEFKEIKAQGLALDMSRGKPSNAQLELSMEMNTIQLPNFAEYAVLTNRIRKDLNIDEIQIFLRGSCGYNAAERLRFD